MGTLVGLAANLAPKAADLLKEDAKHMWEIMTEDAIDKFGNSVKINNSDNRKPKIGCKD